MAGAFQADAFQNDAFQVEAPTSFTADAVIRKARAGSFTADAYIQALRLGSVTAYALIQKGKTSSFTVDAVIGRTLLFNAVIKGTQTRSFTLDAWIYSPRTVPPLPNQTPLTQILVGDVDVSDDVIYSDADFLALVNGAVGQFRIRVRDDGHTYDFTSGVEIAVNIDGRRRFGGYVMLVSRMYAFPVQDTSSPADVARFWVLSGTDYNILFQKRILYDPSNLANVNLRSWPADSDDDVVIRYVFDNYTDLAADGATTAGVTHVGSPNPDRKGVVGSAGLTFGDAMREINRLISAVFYFNPYKELVFVDVDVPSASKSFSDNPSGGTEIGYREFGHTENGSNLVNDALVWGAGTGSTRMTFSRSEDAASQAAHGLWQWGEFTSLLYKQASVDQRADSVVNGTPQSKRGGKDDQVSWKVTTFDTAFDVGERVQIESHVWGVSDVVPIRRLRLTFPEKHPKFELVLSHEIDQPWNLFEFYFPKLTFGLLPFPLFPGGVFPAAAHFFFGTFTFASDGAGSSDGIGGTTIYADCNMPSMFLPNNSSWSYAMGMIMFGDGTANSDYAPMMGLGHVHPGGGVAFLSWAGTIGSSSPPYTIGISGTFNITNQGGSVVEAISSLAAGAHVPKTVNITFWFDPSGWSGETPLPGQTVTDVPFPDVTDQTNKRYFTTYPYEPGSLLVYIDGVLVAATETDPSTGLFTLAVSRGRDQVITVLYAYAGGTARPVGSFGFGASRLDTVGNGGTTFTLPSPYIPGTTRVFKNGLFQRPRGLEYTETDHSTGEIEFDSATSLSDKITVFYEAAGGPS